MSDINNRYLFIGKRIDNGEWVEGSLVSGFNGDTTRAFIFNGEMVGKAQPLDFGCEVDPSTVGQVFLTMLERLPRIAIGDIVEVKGRKRVGNYIAEIIHHKNGGFTLSENNTYFNDDAVTNSILHIIGNIHDNPDLLK